MRYITFLFASILTITFLSCTTENDSNLVSKNSPTVKVFEYTAKDGQSIDGIRSIEGTVCGEPVRLMAGQHHEAGTVTISNDGENIIITYTTNEDWTIDLTHLSVGDCDDKWVPTTGSGNPKVGHFEHTEPHSIDVNEVVYVISLDVLEGLDRFCFAAHAEVEGPTGGETAWAEGLEFDGNSWAMYNEAYLSTCEDTIPADVE